mgnify:FL=1
MSQQFIGQSSSSLNNNINTAVILAAGRGERIAGGEEHRSKPLIKLYDISLIERSVKKLSDKLKINKIYVITGFEHDELKIHLDKLKKKLNVDLEVVFAKEWEKGNGASFLSVLNHIKQKQFYLLMVDHIFNDEFYSTISKSKINNTKCYLTISKSLSSMHDYNDATRVKIVENKITNIGKSISEVDGFDTGFFVLRSETFNDVKNLSEKKSLSISDVMQELIQEQKLYFIEVAAESWLDIDTKKDFSNAKYFLLNFSSSKTNDGLISTYLNRRISNWITSKIVDYPITPNQISVVTFLISVIASLIIVKQGYFFLVLGALLAQLSSILDGCDGEVARLKLLSSKYGGWFDQVLDRYSDLFIITGLTFHTYLLHETLAVFIIGFIAVGGKIILSYTAYVYDSVISKHNNFRIGRDITIFIILVGAIMNIPYITLVILAVVTNVEVCRRLWSLKNKLDLF